MTAAKTSARYEVKTSGSFGSWIYSVCDTANGTIVSRSAVLARAEEVARALNLAAALPAVREALSSNAAIPCRLACFASQRCNPCPTCEARSALSALDAAGGAA